MSYKKSKIYRLGLKQALLAEAACRKLPKHELFALAQQIRNASRSVVANYVESYVRQKYFPSDCQRFLIYSQGSCDETKFWLEFGQRAGLLDEAAFRELMAGYERLSMMLTRTLKTLRDHMPP